MFDVFVKPIRHHSMSAFRVDVRLKNKASFGNVSEPIDAFALDAWQRCPPETRDAIAIRSRKNMVRESDSPRRFYVECHCRFFKGPRGRTVELTRRRESKHPSP